MSPQEAWRGVAEAIVRRRAERGWTQMDIASRGPLSLDRVQSLEGAKRTSYRAGTIAALERALEWQYGSVEAILAGKEPRVIDGPYAEYTLTGEQLRELARRLPAETIREIYRESETLVDDSDAGAITVQSKYAESWKEAIWRITELSETERRVAIVSIEAFRHGQENESEKRQDRTG